MKNGLRNYPLEKTENIKQATSKCDLTFYT